jgi:hypothetical protein
MLRSYCYFAHTYVNNIVIFSKTLENYVQHLHIIFELLDFKEITLLLKKLFVEYSIISFFEQKINAFDLIVVTNKINVIKRLDFLFTLIDLKLYLDLTR